MKLYFDNAATTFPKPEEVYTFMDSFYREHGGNAGRGQYKLAGEATKMIAETREYLQNLLKCNNKDVFFTASDTLALNMVIQGTIDYGISCVYISPFEHNSVTRVLAHYRDRIKVKLLPITSKYSYDIELIKKQFKELPPDMVIVSHASNVCGLIAPVEEIFSLAKQYNAITVLDMAQTAGLIDFNVGSDNVDYATFAGHKTLYGPFGASGFVKKHKIKLRPIIFGGTGVDSANQDMPDILPYQFEPGSCNIQAIAGLHASLEWLKNNILCVRAREKVNHGRLLEILTKFSNIKIVGPVDRSNCVGVVSCLFDRYSSDSIGDVLGSEFNISVRTGLECSPIAHRTLGTFPEGTVRFSVGYFNDDEDFSSLEAALRYIEVNG